MFIYYLLKNNIANKLYMLGFVVAVLSYSFWVDIESMLEFTDEQSGSFFYIGIAFSFCCYTSAYMFSKWDKWRWFPMIVVFICLSRFIKEIYYLYYPDEVTKYDWFDYINFLVTLWIVFNYYIKHRYKQWKNTLKK